MFGSNVPAKLKTVKGSIYEVSADGLVRTRYTGEKSVGAKNVFYTSFKDSETLLKLKDKTVDGGKVSLVAHDPTKAQISFATGEGTIAKPLVFDVLTQPVIQACPVDVILEKDGKFADDHRFHVGDYIVHVLHGA